MTIKFLTPMMMLLSSYSFAEYTINHELLYDPKQIKFVNQAYFIAKEEGIKNHSLLLGVLYKESKLGAHPNYKITASKSKYPNYGIGQMTLPTAIDVIKDNPEIKNEFDINSTSDIKFLLMNNATFAIKLTAKRLLQLGINKNPAKAVMAYNTGPAKVSTNPQNFYYTKSVYNYAEKFKEKY